MTSVPERRRPTRIKFCGITNPRDAALAFEAGADSIGAILAPSPRQVDVAMARILANAAPRSSALVAVVGKDLSIVPRLRDLGLRIQFAAPIEASDALRLTGGAPYLRVVHLGALDETEIDALSIAPGEIPLFDTAARRRLGGSGRTFCWNRITNVAARHPIVVAGGLDAGNVAACVNAVRPYGVDVRSGIETAGRKSLAKMRAFVCAVREADAAIDA
jgi:phosphoribosylanthranilate isomerase